MTDTLTHTTTEVQHQDLLGYDLAAGDHVVYPTGSGSDKRMCVAQIIEVIDYDETYYWSAEPRTRWKVRLQPKIYNDYRGSYGWTGEGEDRRYGKLDQPPRQVVVHNVANLVKVTLREANGS